MLVLVEAGEVVLRTHNCAGREFATDGGRWESANCWAGANIWQHSAVKRTPGAGPEAQVQGGGVPARRARPLRLRCVERR